MFVELYNYREVKNIMKKSIFRKLMMLGTVFVMLFSFAAFSGCKDTLEEYKANAIAELQEFVEALDEDDFCKENWERIESYVADGKIAINAAETKPAVANARDEAKKNIGAVPQSENNEIVFEERVFGGHFFWESIGDLSAIIRSHNELTAFFEEYTVVLWQDALSICEQYDVDFFESTALILFFSWQSGSDVTRYLDAVSVDGKTLILHINYHFSCCAVNDDAVFFSLVLEVEKEDLVGVEYVVAEIYAYTTKIL